MVIQRLQNLYLLVSVILMVIFSLATYAVVETADAVYEMNCYQMTKFQSGESSLTLVSLVLALLAILLPIVSICKYKDLKAQKTAVGISSFISFVLMAYLCVNTYVFAGNVSGTVEPFFTVILPIAAFVLELMARRGIKHDIKLLSDSDRLR
ncbi:MAG: DUF4293 family protein [Muribaculaceae bacterium]